jgi:hypothetical protein
MSADLALDELRAAVEATLWCRATFSKSVPVSEELSGYGAWDGVVHIFDLVGHPAQTVAYAWSELLAGDIPRFFVFPQDKLIASPAHAVRVALMERRRRMPG